MAIDLTELVEEADRYLDAARIQDYCPNGLQVQGRPQVRRIVSGVTASQALLDAAVAAQADAVLVSPWTSTQSGCSASSTLSTRLISLAYRPLSVWLGTMMSRSCCARRSNRAIT